MFREVFENVFAGQMEGAGEISKGCSILFFLFSFFFVPISQPFCPLLTTGTKMTDIRAGSGSAACVRTAWLRTVDSAPTAR